MLAKEIIQRHSKLIHWVAGNENVTVEVPDHLATERPNSLIFVGAAADVETALKSKSVMIVCAESIEKEFAEKIDGDNRCLASTKNTKVTMALINQDLFKYKDEYAPWGNENIHPTATIHETAEVDSSASIGAGTTVGANAIVKARVKIGPNSTIGPGTVIGEDSVIHAQVYIAHHCEIGNRCEIHPQTSIGTEGFGYADDEKFNHIRVPHFGKSILEDEVDVGSCVNIDRGTFKDSIIRRGTKIDGHCHLGHNHDIGRNCLITAGFIMAGSTTIGDNFVCGGRTSVGGHIKVGNNIQMVALSTVTKSVDKPGVYGGYPLMAHKDHLRAQTLVARLPEMKKLLGQIRKKLDL